MTTLPLSCCSHGRTVTVTRRASLVVLLSVSEPTVPDASRVCSSTRRRDRQPTAACAVEALTEHAKAGDDHRHGKTPASSQRPSENPSSNYQTHAALSLSAERVSPVCLSGH